MKRRHFLMSAAAATGAGLVRPVAGFARSARRHDPLDRISIMSLNFQNNLQVPDSEPSADRNISLFEFPEFLADTYGVHKIEWQHYHLESTEKPYLLELRKRMEAVGSTAEQINLEFGGLNISEERTRDRLLAIDLTKQFVDHAITLGVKRLMINQGELTSLSKERATETLAIMADYGRAHNIIISVETRGGVQDPDEERVPGLPTTSPEMWALLSEVIADANAYSVVDFGGARAANQQQLHDALRIFFPTTSNALHARVNDNWDLATAVRYLENDLGYNGIYTVEVRGHEGTKHITDIISSTLADLS